MEQSKPKSIIKNKMYIILGILAIVAVFYTAVYFYQRATRESSFPLNHGKPLDVNQPAIKE